MAQLSFRVCVFEVPTLNETIAYDIYILEVATISSMMSPKSVDSPDMVKPKEAKIYPLHNVLVC